MTNHETDRPAAVPPPMSRAAKAEALLLRFTAEAHRRKWNYDRGLDGDGVPVKSEAFDALHRLGEEMRVALEELRRMPAAVSVPPPAPRADDQAAVRDRIAEALRFWVHPTDRREAADAVLAVLPEPADQAAVLNHAADEVFALDYDAMVGEEGDENLGSMREAWDLGTIHAMELLRSLAAEPVPCAAGEQQNETPEAEPEFVGTQPCGHDDYHDGHPWHDRPGVWCPGIGYDEPAEEPRREPHPTEADLRHALATLDRFHGRGTAETPQTGTLPKRPPMDARRLLGIDACPTPLTHNLGCGCPTDQTPAAPARPAEDPS